MQEEKGEKIGKRTSPHGRTALRTRCSIRSLLLTAQHQDPAGQVESSGAWRGAAGQAGPCPDRAMTAELPVWVFGRCRWVSGVCRRTTCQDVLEAVLTAPTPAPADQDPAPGAGPAGPGGHFDPAAYVIVERWKGVERRLDGRVRILKVWSAWGEAQSEVQLQVRRVSEKGAGRHGSSASSRRHRKRSGTKGRPGQRPSPTVKQHDQEEVHRLMRLILAQGETIAGQLRRLREREAQIERLETEAHRERVAQHGKDYVLAAYLRDTEDGDELAKHAQDTPRTSRHQPGSYSPSRSKTAWSRNYSMGMMQLSRVEQLIKESAHFSRPAGALRPRQLVAEDDLEHFADESDAEQEGAAAMAAESAGALPREPPETPLRSPEQPPEAAVDEEDLRAQIALWEKVVKVNKRLEQQEERLVRLYVGFRRSAPDGLAVDDRDQVRTSLARLQQDIEDGRRSLQSNADLLTETEALLDAKRRLLRRLLAEMEAAELDTARLMAVRDAARDATLADTAPALVATPIPVPCSSQLSQLPLTQSQPIKGHDNDSNSDTGLSSLHSSSEEGVYILDTLV
ncbi:hypothetical protein FOCC_FOCC008881 [Frankliniella occidentalis]|nr:hypothetical protein FOCC_FOCC008881 [Frankliniella occidentalis]